MALLFMDSFDHYADTDVTEKYDAGSTAWLSGSPVRTGPKAAWLLGSFALGKSVTPGDVFVVGFAFHTNAFHDVKDILYCRESAIDHLVLNVSGTGLLRVKRGSTILATATAGAGALAVDTWYYIELKFRIHDTLGSVVVRVNEVPVTWDASVTNIDTQNGGTGNVGQLYFHSGNIGGQYVYLDDLYILDDAGAAPLNDFLGACRVDARYPTAEGASSAWTPLSGTDNALMVDETAPDDDTTYNSTSSVGATDTHVVQDAPVPGGVLLGVQLCLSQKKTDAGTVTLAPVVRHSGTNYSGTAFNPTTAYGYACTPYGTNPGTGAVWTEAEFNAAEFGYTRTA